MATVRTLPPPSRATAAAAAAAASRPFSLRSEVWANPVVSPATTRMPAPRERPDESSSTRRSSSMALADVASSAKTSAMSPPWASAAERTLCSTPGSIREVSVTGGIVIVVSCPSSDSTPSAGHGPHSGLSAQVELTVGEEDTARALPLGRRPGAGDAPAHRHVRGGRPPGDRRAPDVDPDQRGHPGPVRPSGPGRRRQGGPGRGDPGQGGGPPPHLHRLGGPPRAATAAASSAPGG